MPKVPGAQELNLVYGREGKMGGIAVIWRGNDTTVDVQLGQLLCLGCDLQYGKLARNSRLFLAA